MSIPPAPSPSPHPEPLDVRDRFPALVAQPEVVHADAPGGTQVVDVALKAMRDAAVHRNANQHAPFAASERVDELCAGARATFAEFLGCEPEGIVFGANMTTLAFHLSHALDEVLATGGEIVCTRLDHDANVSPWLGLAERTGTRVRFLDIDADGRLDLTTLDAITDRARLVAFPLASNALGTHVDPLSIVEAANAVGAITVADAVHAAPHMPLDRAGADIDVLFCSPYKFFGPHAGVMAANPALLERLTPDKVRPSPDSGPERWQTGTASFEAVAAAGAAARYVMDDVGLGRLVGHEQVLSQHFLDGLADRPDWTLHGIAEPTGRTPTFAITHASMSPGAVAEQLARLNVNVYPGHNYAIEPMRALGLLEGGGTVRIGFVHYHGTEDVDRVLTALDAVTPE